MVTRIGVCGAAGRMGQAIIQTCDEKKDIELTAAIEHHGSPYLNLDAGEQAGIVPLGVSIGDNISMITEQIDVLIDFTVASSITETVEKCHAARKPLVIGTTGLNEKQQKMLHQAGQDIAIIFAPNMSIGINLCLKLLKIVTQTVGQDADIDILEAHHKYKKDAPSGTALQMGEVIAEALGKTLPECAVYNAIGRAEARQENSIGFNSIRAGNIIGEHKVMFHLAGENLEISHKATSRKNFALGAIRAAQWLKNKPPGLFNMQDVICC
ncbi:4-hydroxy-tetrahydrodipicolinate reductase [uncultured Candidatus Thioglobus sp.]|nr:4-hydroxy-tetrahydrodipicolinate reductase [uncultured Candidatus Thioglobus sp.]